MNTSVTAGEYQAGKSATFPWRFVAVVSILLMEMSLIVPWLWLIARPLNPIGVGSLLIWFLIFALLARGLYRFSQTNNVRTGISLGASGILLIGGILLSLNLVTESRPLLDIGGALRAGLRALPSLYPMAPELPIMVLVVIIWRRGVTAASATILEPARTGFKFRMGVLILVALSIASERTAVPLAVPTFFLSSLLAMSLTRADYLTKLRGSSEPPFSLQWLLSLAGLFVLVLSTGLALGWLLASAVAIRFLEGARALIIEVLGLFYRLSLPLLIALEPLLQGLLGRFRRFLLDLESGESGALVEPGSAAQQLEGLEPPAFFQQINDFLASLLPYWPIVRTVVIAAILLLVLISAIRLIQRQTRLSSSRRRQVDEGEGMPIEMDLRLGERLRRWRQELGSWGRAVVSGQLSTAIVVRRLYARLLSLAEEYGRSRYRWETPLEFELALGRLFPERKAEIKTLTEAYVRVRYGQIAETSDLVQQVRQAWQGIQDEYR